MLRLTTRENYAQVWKDGTRHQKTVVEIQKEIDYERERFLQSAKSLRDALDREILNVEDKPAEWMPDVMGISSKAGDIEATGARIAAMHACLLNVTSIAKMCDEEGHAPGLRGTLKEWAEQQPVALTVMDVGIAHIPDVGTLVDRPSAFSLTDYRVSSCVAGTMWFTPRVAS